MIGHEDVLWRAMPKYGMPFRCIALVKNILGYENKCHGGVTMDFLITIQLHEGSESFLLCGCNLQ